MSFGTLNSINAARNQAVAPQAAPRAGMAGTAPSGPPMPMTQAGPQQPQGGVQYGPMMGGAPAPMQAPQGSSYTRGMGMRGPTAPTVGDPVPQANPRGAVMAGLTTNGVYPGQAGPSAVPPMPQGPQFDPNDGANAALAGYMHSSGNGVSRSGRS